MRRKELSEMSKNWTGRADLVFVQGKNTIEKTFVTDIDSCYYIAEKVYEEHNAATELYEYVFVVMLTKTGKVIGSTKIGEGGTDYCPACIKKIMQAAVLSGCSYIVLLHNHPQSVAQPSNMDRSFTENVCKACKLFEIKVLDHIILGDTESGNHHNYYSFKSNGLI